VAGVDFLSAEWLALARELFGGLPPRSGASARIQHVVSGAPGGDVAFDLTFEDGRLVDATPAPGAAPGPGAELTITTTYPDTRCWASGDLDLSVAVMRGQAKVAGAMGALLAILPVMRTPEFRTALAALHERTVPPA